APKRICAAAPASSGVVTAERSSSRPVATSQTVQPSATGSHTSPHAILIDANSRGGADRAARTRNHRWHRTASRYVPSAAAATGSAPASDAPAATTTAPDSTESDHTAARSWPGIIGARSTVDQNVTSVVRTVIPTNPSTL